MFREVPMVEVRQVLRLRQQVKYGREIARRTGLDRKTVSRYLKLAEEAGFDPAGGRSIDEMVAAVIGRLRPGRPPGDHAEAGRCWRDSTSS